MIDWKSAAAPEVGAELSDEELRARSLAAGRGGARPGTASRSGAAALTRRA